MLTAQVGSCPWWAVGRFLCLSSWKKCSWVYGMIVRLQIACESTSSFAGRPIRSRVGSENGLDTAVCRCWGKLDGSTGQASLWQQLSIKNKCANSNIKRKKAIDLTEEPAAALIWRRWRPAGMAATVDSKTANQTHKNCQMTFKRQLIVKVEKINLSLYTSTDNWWNFIGSSCEYNYRASRNISARKWTRVENTLA